MRASVETNWPSSVSRSNSMPMPTPKPANRYIPPTTDKSQLAVWQRINWMLDELERINGRLSGLGAGDQARMIQDLRVQIAAVEDAQTQAQTFVGAGGTSFNATGASLSASGVGLSISGSTAAGSITVTNAGTFRSAIGLGNLAILNPGTAVPNSGVVAGVGYVQADFQSVINTLNALLGSLRTAGIIAT